MSDLLAKSKDKYTERDEKRKELYKLHRKIGKQYRQAEDAFVPLFDGLASSHPEI